MKKLLIPAMLLAAASSYGITVASPNGLTEATGARLTDYTNWFTPGFKVYSDADYTGTPSPLNNLPPAFSDANRTWSGWKANWGATALSGPIVDTSLPNLVTKVEFAFLGETAGWWNNIGYRLNGVDHLLADGIETVSPISNEKFGNYWQTSIMAGDTLDFFVVGTETHTSPNGIINPTPNWGGKYFVFDQSANIPASATEQSYYGQLQPQTNARMVDPSVDLYRQSWTVMGFEEVQTRFNSNIDYNDLVFAFRVFDVLPLHPVPEPSAYGLMGGAALLALAGYRRFWKV